MYIRCIMGNLLWNHKKAKMGDETESATEEFPSTLEGFGYYFNEEGKLRKKETEEQFEFVVKRENHSYNQKHYEALGDVITEHIYQLMTDKYELKKETLPVDAKDEPTTFIYRSEDALSNPDKLLILIHGSGAVRAGQWARRLIINDCLDSGTQLPFIDWGLKNKYGVIVANTNLNEAEHDGKKKDIRGNSSPEEHTESVWTDFVSKAKAKHIAIVAHSYGGVCTLELAIKHEEDFWKRVFAIALTDSVHSLSHQQASKGVKKFYAERVINWASAFKTPLDEPLESQMSSCKTLSAGTDRHDYTSYSCMKSIFKFFDKEYSERIKSTNNLESNKYEESQNVAEQTCGKKDSKEPPKEEVCESSTEKNKSEQDQEVQPMSQDDSEPPKSGHSQDKIKLETKL